MGRVTRMIKAAADPRESTNGPEKNAVDRDLLRVIAAWPRLPEHHRRTMLTLVELVEHKHGT